jgi:hypothetical protein
MADAAGAEVAKLYDRLELYSLCLSQAPQLCQAYRKALAIYTPDSKGIKFHFTTWHEFHLQLRAHQFNIFDGVRSTCVNIFCKIANVYSFG